MSLIYKIISVSSLFISGLCFFSCGKSNDLPKSNNAPDTHSIDKTVYVCDCIEDVGGAKRGEIVVFQGVSAPDECKKLYFRARPENCR